MAEMESSQSRAMSLLDESGTREWDGSGSTSVSTVEIRKLQTALEAANERLSELARANEALRRTAERLAANPSLDSFLGFVLLEIASQLRADAAHLTVYDAKTDTIRTAATVDNGVLGPLPLDPLLPREDAQADS